MMNRKRNVNRPSDPAAIALRRALERTRLLDPASWGLDREALELESNADVDRRADVAGRVLRARRQDVFDLMAARGRMSATAVNAIRRLQDDIACLHRTATGVMSYAPRVDRSRKPDGFSDSRRRAGARIDAVLALAGPATSRLLEALCEPDVILGRAADWRAVIERETGERLADGQSAVLRIACENLVGAYDLLDRRDRATPPSPWPP